MDDELATRLDGVLTLLGLLLAAVLLQPVLPPILLAIAGLLAAAGTIALAVVGGGPAG